ncbi:cellulase family glycosylhydrolase [Solwaraspora sp. WMMD406]|uniref:cellulase family glycosylhydrolase n=1 Tax=Solwaraspora sp. WMMD406 TaxID=3016095 RepID=UPI0024165D39|nr:cellulase family glycosylhydrolase [Solwaraspora sp. WMMD406]MDG4765269.1 cellulase family glycosylhydrolase [Solwaraspora sp. WMMD406]
MPSIRTSIRTRWAATTAAALLLGAVAAVPTTATAAAAPPAAPTTATAEATAEAPAEAVAEAVPENDWLHTDGNTIVDEAGNQVWLTGANWFGYNATERVFHGLWSANIEAVTRAMSQRGINIVRVPISTQLLLEWKAGQPLARPNINAYVNPELDGLNNLQIFDYWLELCEKYGLKVMLDVHSAEADNSGHLYPVWWKGSITVEDFYQGWEWVTTRYRDNDTIVAMDIKNEPHGTPNDPQRAKWDSSTDQDNFKHACETAGRRILAINPNLLILCEGIEVYPRAHADWDSPNTNPDLSPNYFYNWWGGNLRGVAEHPIDLGANQDQLVYSPHDYGPLVYEQPWFQGEFDKASLTEDVWRPNWLYIHEDDTAPLLIGEWGGRYGQDARQDKWLHALRDLMIDYGIHHTFWSLNPNSGDTGGLLLDDWTSWDEVKYNEVLKPALWQHDGTFVGLDHQVPLGGVGSTTGISLGQRYSDGGGDDDVTVPTAPGQPAASDVTADSVTLTWTASTDNVGVTSYQVLRSTAGGPATPVATVSGTTYTASGLTPETSYTFTVRARDAAGNVSPSSPARTVTTAANDGGPGDDGCTATYTVTSSWQGGFQGGVEVRNTGTSAISGWTVTWTNPSGTSIASLWNGRLTTSGAAVTVRNEAYNGALAPTAATSFGFLGSGSSATPADLTCTAS